MSWLGGRSGSGDGRRGCARRYCGYRLVEELELLGRVVGQLLVHGRGARLARDDGAFLGGAGSIALLRTHRNDGDGGELGADVVGDLLRGHGVAEEAEPQAVPAASLPAPLDRIQRVRT